MDFWPFVACDCRPLRHHQPARDTLLSQIRPNLSALETSAEEEPQPHPLSSFTLPSTPPLSQTSTTRKPPRPAALRPKNSLTMMVWLTWNAVNVPRFLLSWLDLPSLTKSTLEPVTILLNKTFLSDSMLTASNFFSSPFSEFSHWLDAFPDPSLSTKHSRVIQLYGFRSWGWNAAAAPVTIECKLNEGMWILTFPIVTYIKVCINEFPCSFLKNYIIIHFVKKILNSLKLLRLHNSGDTFTSLPIICHGCEDIPSMGCMPLFWIHCLLVSSFCKPSASLKNFNHLEE